MAIRLEGRDGSEWEWIHQREDNESMAENVQSMNSGMGQEEVRGYHWSSTRMTTRSDVNDVSHK